MKLATLAPILLAALALCACGSSSTTTSGSAAQPGSPTSSTASAPASPGKPTTSSTTTTSSTRPISATPRCTAASLAVSVLGQQGATGHGEIGFALRNIGTSSCRTFGYPGVLFLDETDRPLPTISTRTTHDFFGTAPLVALIVAPGASVSFRLGVTHGINSSVGCSTAYGLQVIPPDDTATLHAPIPQGVFQCRTATVSPLRPGTSAYR